METTPSLAIDTYVLAGSDTVRPGVVCGTLLVAGDEIEDEDVGLIWVVALDGTCHEMLVMVFVCVSVIMIVMKDVVGPVVRFAVSEDEELERGGGEIGELKAVVDENMELELFKMVVVEVEVLMLGELNVWEDACTVTTTVWVAPGVSVTLGEVASSGTVVKAEDLAVLLL